MKSKRVSLALAAMFLVLLISGCGGGGSGDSSPTVPVAPTGVTATAGNGSVAIGWPAVTGATSYNIYRSTTAGVTKANGTRIAGAASPYLDNNLTNGTTYYYVVTAVNAVGESADSSQVSATPTLAPPAAPTGVAPTAGHGEVTISWSAVAGATSYNIYFDNTAGVTTSDNKRTGVVSPNIVTGLTNGTTYYFVVTAVNAAGEGPISSEVSATPTAAPLPPAPTNVTAAAGAHEATITWTAATGAVSYNIYFDNTTPVTKAAPNKITGVTASPRPVTGLVNGTKYYFRVTTVNANGESDLSNEASAIPNPFPAPPAPAGVSAAAASGGATISWSAATGATSYNIYYSTTSGVTKANGTKVAGVVSGATVTGLIRGTPYYFVVTAVNSDGIEGVDSGLPAATAIPDAPNPTFGQSDLTGTWNVRVILSGTTLGWYGFTATVDSEGKVVSIPDILSPTTAPALPALSITSGTGVSAGVVTETGGGSNITFHGKMTTSKNMIIGTSTLPGDTAFALHVFVKRVPGVTFSSSDLANPSIAYQRIYSGGDYSWEKGFGSINGSGLMSFSSAENSTTGPISPPAAAISVNSTTGIVSIVGEEFSGVMSPDKKVIVGTSTDSFGVYSIRIIQMRGQTYARADLAGTYYIRAFANNPAGWVYGTFDTTATGVTTCITFSSGGCIGPYTMSISPTGEVTNENPDATLGLMSFGKDMVVIIGSTPIGPVKTGAFMEIRAE